MITDVLYDEKRVNMCEHMVMLALHESFSKVPPKWLRDRMEGGSDGGKIEWKSSEVNTRAVSRGLR